MNENKTVYRVTWWPAGAPRPRRYDDCVITPGYSTFADIPKMLSIMYGVPVERVEIFSAIRIEP